MGYALTAAATLVLTFVVAVILEAICALVEWLRRLAATAGGQQGEDDATAV